MKLSLLRFLESSNGETRMPNHTQNEVLIETNTNEEQEVLALQILKNDLGIKDGQFDFNGVIPMPNEIKKGAEINIEDFKYVPKDLEDQKYACL